MNTILRSKAGSAHVAAIAILAVALLGALGFIFWQNFIQPKVAPEVASTTQPAGEAPSLQSSAGRSYSNAEYSFSYPNEGWVVKEVEDLTSSSDLTTPTVYSNDYAQQGMGLDAGALVGVYASSTGNTLEEEYDSIKASQDTFGLKDIKKATINAQPAITYNSEYEGPRYHTVFIKNGKMYDIVYQYAYQQSADIHMDTYELITSSFRFTE